MTELYITVGKNHLYASQGRASANDLAVKAQALFQADADLSATYNHTLAGGKWDHMMDQTHIGYTTWRDPPTNIMPNVNTIEVPVAAKLGVAVEGSRDAWPGSSSTPALPQIDVFNQQRRYIEIFDRGQTTFEFTAKASEPWVSVSTTQGTVEKNKDQRLLVSVDWSKAPKGTNTAFVKITGAGDEVKVSVEAFHPETPARAALQGFVETNGYVSIEAEHYTKTDAGPVRWEKISDYGRTLSSMTIFPVTAESVAPPRNSPCLEYKMYLFKAGKVNVEAILAPTLNFVPGRGLRYAVSFDDQPPQVVDALSHNSTEDWSESVKDSVRKVTSTLDAGAPGYHTLKFCMVDPGVVLEKIVVDAGGVKPSYLGPPESYRAASP